ncbi:MAG: DNA gyrase subunit A, partial [Oscillospiraceae bacterium]|nr:DNA gyrase subunit A [Oscillospiraceae bacterium]
NRFLVMVTRNGTVKRLPVETLRNVRNRGIRALTLDDGDRLIAVRETDGNRKILIASHDGQAVLFPETEVRPSGRAASGVRGIKLRDGDFVVGADCAPDGATVLSVTENGFGKRSPIESYRLTARGGSGVKNYNVTDKTGKIVGVRVVDGSEDVLLMTRNGNLLRTAVQRISVVGRASQGVIVMRFREDGDQLISMALASSELDPPEELPPASPKA